MRDGQIFTFKTRVSLTCIVAEKLDAYAAQDQRVERLLYTQWRRQWKPDSANPTQKSIILPTASFKRDYCRMHGLTGRQFNSIRIRLDGRIEAARELRKEHIQDTARRLVRADKVLKKLEKVPKTETHAEREVRLKAVHEKQRRRAAMASKLARLEYEHASGIVSLSFGSKKLFHKQFYLNENGYRDHAEWLADWQAMRCNRFTIVGSGDETAGNQGCVARLQPDGALTLEVRLLNYIIAPHGGAVTMNHPNNYLTLKDVRFAYGHEKVVHALTHYGYVTRTTKSGRQATVRDGSSMTYHLQRDHKGWTVAVSFTVEAPARVSQHKRCNGVVGVDFNMDHLAVAQTTADGNLVAHTSINLFLKHKTSNQRKAILGDAVKELVSLAVASKRPIGIEKLDFREKKAELEAVAPWKARMLSSLAYRQFEIMLRSAAFRAGIEVIAVNPAFTSVIGAVNYAPLYGISVHRAAAYAIARRVLGLNEKPFAKYERTTIDGPVAVVVVPLRHGGHVTFDLPVRNRTKHVWSQWRVIRQRQQTALRAHFRSVRALAQANPSTTAPSKSPPSLKAVMQAAGVCRISRRMPGVKISMPL